MCVVKCRARFSDGLGQKTEPQRSEPGKRDKPDYLAAPMA